MLKVTLGYLFDDELDLEVRTGALYTLYGIYFHQVDKPKMKVRKKKLYLKKLDSTLLFNLKIQVTQLQWLEILSFIGCITIKEENADVEYIFRFLLHSDAFDFCATSNNIVIFKQHQLEKYLKRKIYSI